MEEVAEVGRWPEFVCRCVIADSGAKVGGTGRVAGRARPISFDHVRFAPPGAMFIGPEALTHDGD